MEKCIILGCSCGNKEFYPCGYCETSENSGFQMDITEDDLISIECLVCGIKTIISR